MLNIIFSAMLKAITLILTISMALGVPLYPTSGETAFFGAQNYDFTFFTTLPPAALCDDCCTNAIPTSGPFEFFGISYTAFTVSLNGVVSFGDECQFRYTPKQFPATENIPVLAPYWADVDNRGKFELKIHIDRPNVTLFRS